MRLITATFSKVLRVSLNSYKVCLLAGLLTCRPLAYMIITKGEGGLEGAEECLAGQCVRHGAG